MNNKEKQVKVIPTAVEIQKQVAPEIIKSWNAPVLVKPKRFYKRDKKEDLTPVLVRPNKSYKAQECNKQISARDKMFSKVKHYEIFNSNPYRGSGGFMTIGYGHTKNVRWDDTITGAETVKL